MGEGWRDRHVLVLPRSMAYVVGQAVELAVGRRRRGCPNGAAISLPEEMLATEPISRLMDLIADADAYILSLKRTIDSTTRSPVNSAPRIRIMRAWLAQGPVS